MGRYETGKDLERLFDYMTDLEKMQIIEKPFPVIWENFVSQCKQLRNDKKGYVNFEKKFNDNRDAIMEALKTSAPEYEGDWGFPKGRQKDRRQRHGGQKEKQIDIAIRELQEEVLISPRSYRYHKKNPIKNQYYGEDNGKPYLDIYYLATFLKEPDIVAGIRTPLEETIVSNEVRRAIWVSIDEASAYLTDDKIECLRQASVKLAEMFE